MSLLPLAYLMFSEGRWKISRSRIMKPVTLTCSWVWQGNPLAGNVTIFTVKKQTVLFIFKKKTRRIQMCLTQVMWASDNLYSCTPPTSSDFPITLQLSKQNTQLMSVCISQLNERKHIFLLRSWGELNVYIIYSEVSALANASILT